MKKTFLLFVFSAGLLIFNHSLSAQDETVANKQFYTELGGPGVIMSINFDTRFDSNNKLGLGCRIGAGFYISDFERNGHYETRTVYSIPVGINYILGKSSSPASLEVGGGVSLLTRKVALFYYDVEEKGNIIGHLNIMFRVTPVGGGMAFRIGFTPIIGTSGDLFPMGAIGFGYSF